MYTLHLVAKVSGIRAHFQKGLSRLTELIIVVAYSCRHTENEDDILRH